jgi:hypothetical protein
MKAGFLFLAVIEPIGLTDAGTATMSKIKPAGAAFDEGPA